MRLGAGVLLVCASVLLPARCSGTLLDWSTVTWPAGSLSQTFTGVDPNNPGSSVTVSISGTTSAFSSGYPAVATSPFTGGTISDSGLQLLVNFPNASANVTVTVSFNYGGAGVQNVNFTLFDIDEGFQGRNVVYQDQ
ncbi:MAG: hypothetical protein KGS61_01875, partial [Verrucomicrobia bacterium]|nr:hypothetical protein [Verrucomicrobiota bacterium]